MQHLVTTTLLLMTVAVGCHSPATALNASERGTPLPDVKDVKTVAIKFDHPKLDDVDFTATPEDWMAIRTGLLPAKVDPKTVAMGMVRNRINHEERWSAV